MTKHLVFFYRCTRKLTWWAASKPLTEAGRCHPSTYILHWPQNSSNVSPQDCFTDANSHCKYRLIIKRHVILLYIIHFINMYNTNENMLNVMSKIHLHNFHIFSFFTGKFSTWLKWCRWYTSKVGHLLNHRRFTATSEITEDSVVCFIEEEEKNNAFTLEFVHTYKQWQRVHAACARTHLHQQRIGLLYYLAKQKICDQLSYYYTYL